MGALTAKQAAMRTTEKLDHVADMVQKNAGAFGIHASIARKFAYQCDLLSDHIEKHAGINRQALTGDDIFDEGAVIGQDPEEIGEEVAGPLEGDSDESFMQGEFTQQENRELREKVESGDISPESTSPDPQPPQAGIQAALAHGARLASVSIAFHEAATRCAADAKFNALSGKLASAASGVLSFQAQVLQGKRSSQSVTNLLEAAGHITPHLASITPTSAEKIARMVDIFQKYTKV